MGEHRQEKASGAAKAGRALLWIGGVVLLGEAAFLLSQLNVYWQSLGAASVGTIAGIGAAAQKAVTFLVWNDGLLLAAMAKVLILCCPLLAIAAGIGLVRKAEYAEARESAVSAKAEEERR